jgi:hypothetical protein
MLRVVALGAATAALLGRAQRAVGQLEQGGGALGVGGISGDARRAAQPAADRRGVLHRHPRRLGECEGPRGVGVRQHDAELVAANAPDDAEVAHGRAQAGRHGGQDLVPERVAVGLVDALEVVEVEQHDGERPLLAARHGQLPAHDLLEAAVVGEAGEGVAVGQLLEVAVVLLEIGGHGVEVA